MGAEHFRSMRRFKNQLETEETKSILKKGKRGVLSIVGDQGYPYGFPVNYFYDEENGKIYFHSAKEGHKIDAIKKCDKASFCVFEEAYQEENGWAYYCKSVIAFGTVTLLKDDQVMKEKVFHLGMKYYPTREDVMKEMKESSHHVAVIEFAIDHMTGKLVHEK